MAIRTVRKQLPGVLVSAALPILLELVARKHPPDAGVVPIAIFTLFPVLRTRRPGAVEVMALGYALGVAGTLWDWHDHLLGPGTQPPHLVIDLGGLVVLGALLFSGKTDLRSRSFAGLYVLLVLAGLITLSPFLLMVTAPRSALMATLMRSTMSNGALLAYLPLVLLAGWSARRWLSLTPASAWRLAAALGIVAVAIATVWDLYWHQTHPMEMGVSMAALPPHQAILAGFALGLIGAAYGAAANLRRPAP